MMNSKILILSFVLLVVLITSACTVEKQDIDYGNVHCYHCDMTVVDKSHAAEYVTKKGKAFFFDAVECLIMKLNDKNNEDEMAFILVADVNNPGNLIDAKNASFVISESIKSPMGANLAAFSSQSDANDYIENNEGEVYNWDAIKIQLNN